MTERNQDSPFCDYASFLRERYGEPVQRVPLDLGLSCPNRDLDGSGGCAFCGELGGRAAHLGGTELPLGEQVRRGIAFARERYGATAFMAYFQAFTSTNAPVGRLRELFAKALAAGEFRGVTVATRPDCLPEETLDLLSELAASHDVWVELGVQTVHDQTLQAIRRGHDAACSERAVRALAARGLPVVPHIILGLPGEDAEKYRETARRLAGWPCSGIKVHNLHIVQGTELAKAWRAGHVPVMDEHQYAEALIDVLRRIPPKWPVLRLASDTPDQLLLAPKWWLGKGQFRQYVVQRMQEKGWRQGDLLTPKPVLASAARKAGKTQQMSLPIEHGPPAPRVNVAAPLLASLRLPKPLPGKSLTVLDVGFGLDTLLVDALPELLAAATERLCLAGFGWDRSLIDVLRRRNPEFDQQLAILGAGLDLSTPQGSAAVHWGDPRRNIFRVRGKADVILVEPRSVEANVILFSIDFLRRLMRLLSSNGVLLATAASASFRGALLRLGLTVGTADPAQVPRGGTVASWDADRILNPLVGKQLHICTETLSCAPYRDLDLRWSRKRILRHRDAVLQRMRRCAERHAQLPTAQTP